MTETASVTKYRLGLDMGTSSIGWAAIELDEDGKPCGVLNLGVRIFPDGRNPRDKTSNAVRRRAARGQRRRRDRYLRRREDLINALIAYGLMPKEEDQRKRIANDAEGFDPYKLRLAALDRALHPFELGRALFHLNQRRGFKSNRKTAGDDDNEAKKTRAEISELRRLIEESGARTLGEFLARRRRKGKSVRARPDTGLYPDRAMYEEEFRKIRAFQEPHQVLSAEQWDYLYGIVFFQRPLKSVDPGWCLFEDREMRAARALPIFQEFRMFQELANLKLQVGTEKERRLNDGERCRALRRLQSGSNINLKKPVKALHLPSGASFNLVRGVRTNIKGDETAAKLAKKEMFGSKWLDVSLHERNAVVKFLIGAEDPEAVRQKATQEWGLTDEQSRALSHVSLVSGYGNLSEKAITKILPHLEQGLGYSDAVRAAGYSHHSDFRNAVAHKRLPYYGEILKRDAVGADPEKDPETDGKPARYGRIPNPTVHIGLNQLRRVVNRIIEVYSKPDEIVIELARDMKMNKERRRIYERRQKEGRERNARIKKCLESTGLKPTHNNLRKLRLWEEQGPPHRRICPYTGKQLSFEMVTSARTEIDHILPFSRTLDNSMNNMVVCMAAANREKGNRTPYEAFGLSSIKYDYDAILANIASFPYGKRWRFQPDAMERFEGDHDFLDRQLNETQYLSRTARRYLAHLYNEKAEGRQLVRAIPGRMTALLRRGWGLNGMLSEPGESQASPKQRDDHRHHALDAFIVANTTQGLLQQFAWAASASYEDAAERLASLVPLPWKGFHRNQLKPFLDELVVSYKPDRGTHGVRGRTTGQLHKETAYGIIDLVENGPSKVVVRKPLSAFKNRGDLEFVRDTELKNALLALWDTVGGRPENFARRAKNKGVLLNGSRQQVRRVRVVDQRRVVPIKDGAGNPYKGYSPGSNEFADVWRMRDGSWKIVAVPTFHANQPDFNIEDFRPADKSGRRDPTAKRLMRLQIDDMGALREKSDRHIVRVRKITTTKTGVLIFLDDHNEANVPSRITKKELKEMKYSARKLQQQGFRKVRVDEIGRVHDLGPFPR